VEVIRRSPIAVIIPTYNETETISVFLRGLSSHMFGHDLIVIADDSDPRFRDKFITMCQNAIENQEVKMLFTFSDSKSGRGFAVRRAMELIQNLDCEIEYVVECDADSSHRVEDVIAIARSNSLSDVLIGSRYLLASAIIGWPRSRQIFSRLINLLIPKILKIDVTDATNGLRRYNKNAITKLLMFEIKNTGFIYLSEQILILARNGCKISELPIIFVNRTIGSSSVTWRDVRSSLFGLFHLALNKKNFDLSLK
jgi:dolichol-phosphate mannosyltransferase